MSGNIALNFPTPHFIIEMLAEGIVGGGPGTDGFETFLKKYSFTEVNIITGTTIDLLGNFEPYPQNGSILEQLSYALRFTPTQRNPAPYATDDPYVAFSIAFGLGQGDIEGVDIELGISKGHYELLLEDSGSFEGSIPSGGAKTLGALWRPDGGGFSWPRKGNPGDPGSRYFFLKDITGSSAYTGTVEYSWTFLISGERAAEVLAQGFSDPDEVLREVLSESPVSLAELVSAVSGNDLLKEEIQEMLLKEQYCFGGDVKITMSDGSRRAIKNISPSDSVLSWDNGKFFSGKVTRTYSNTSEFLLDYFGTEVTPGHCFLSVDRETGLSDYKPIIEILRTDGIIIVDGGERLRAATLERVGDRGDALIKVVTDEQYEQESTKYIRAGTRFISDGLEWRLLDLLDLNGYTISDEGFIVDVTNRAASLFWRGRIPNPEDYVLDRSNLEIEKRGHNR